MGKMIWLFLVFVLMAGASLVPPSAVAADEKEGPEYGPAKGTLIVIGGGDDTGTGIEEKFIELAGGKDAAVCHRSHRRRQPEPGSDAESLFGREGAGVLAQTRPNERSDAPHGRPEGR